LKHLASVLPSSWYNIKMNLKKELKREVKVFIIASFFSTCFFFLTITALYRQYKIPVFAQMTEFSPIPIETSPVLSITPSETPTPPTFTTVPSSAPDSPTPQSLKYPSQILNLTNWKLTLPTGKSKKPVEIKQPELAKFIIDPWFVIDPSGGGVRFRAPVNGVTTSGSGYPRSELREMTDNGKNNASWSSMSGTHTMFLDEAITAVPLKKKHVVAGQIHDGDDDVIVIRLEYPNLYVNVDGDNEYTLDSNYTLGKRFAVKFEVKDGKTNVFYNNSYEPVYVLDKSYSGAYFKAGAYTQSNCSKEDSSSCNFDNYGEVVIYQLSISH